MPDLIAGYTGIRDKPTAGYAGALRRTPRSVPAWTCRHAHQTPVTARTCAEGELERRGQGEREVFTLLYCKTCDEGGYSAWWADADGTAFCARCGCTLERVKLVVLERTPAVDAGNGKH